MTTHEDLKDIFEQVVMVMTKRMRHNRPDSLLCERVVRSAVNMCLHVTRLMDLKGGAADPERVQALQHALALEVKQMRQVLLGVENLLQVKNKTQLTVWQRIDKAVRGH